MENETEVFTLKRNLSEFIKDGLDQEQLEAVTKSEGNTLIIAGPGSGKTRVITYKIAYLLDNHVRAENILLVTFTRAAAKQMIERVKKVTEKDTSQLVAGTFHHVCNLILRKYANILGYANSYSILDSEDADDLLKMARNEYRSEYSLDKELPKESVVSKIISYACNTVKSVREALGDIAPYLMEFEGDIEKIWMKYAQMKKDMNSMDYDDILVNTGHLLSTNPDILKKVSSQFRYVLVDEFQDTSKIQLEIVRALSSVHKNLIAVGDDAQSIYSFRGARFENIQEFMEIKGTKLFKIQKNYRSVPEIVQLINTMLPEKAIPKKLESVRKTGVLPFMIETFDDSEQSEVVCKIIADKIDEGLEYKDIAVLYRTHSLSMVLQQKMDSKRLPYRLLSGRKFIETAHIKDMLSFVKVLQNPLDKISWSRALKLFPGLGAKTAIRIYEEIGSELLKESDFETALKNSSIKKNKDALKIFSTLISMSEQNPSKVLEYIYNTFYQEYSRLSFPDYRSRNSDVERFIDIAGRYDNISRFLEEMVLSENVQVIAPSQEDKENKITMSTIHGAKGLEWKVVILISVNP
ncbi:MAG TPA: ATP-dependent helicase, partial [Petrotogaceae bacterium]|nr:ATP-dependent helicase [Petrotogaceae bacterium]